jgi:hypothetical protein
MAIDLNLAPVDVDLFDLNEAAAVEDEQAAAVEDEQAAVVEDEQAAAQVDVQDAAPEDVQPARHHFDLNIPVFDEHEEIHGGNHVLPYKGCIFYSEKVDNASNTCSYQMMKTTVITREEN